MASTVPASLKSADVNRFALRATQIEKVKPAVAYWSYYWIVQQIVMRSLHNADDDSKAYTSNLMDKLEQMKLEHAQDDAVTDDVAGKALIEQFGLDIFKKAENAMRANKVSRQTADTFSAGATFLELLGIWPPMDQEIAAKIKFAKYHALRIAKALKAGENPNLSNPSLDSAPEEQIAPPPLDPTDPEVQALGGLGTQPSQPEDLSRQPSVEDVPDEQDRLESSLAHTSTINESLHPSRAPSVPPNKVPPPPAENYYQPAGNGDVSPLGPDPSDKPPSEGGGYFPHVPPNDQRVDPVHRQAPPGFSTHPTSQVSPPAAPPPPPPPPQMSPISVPPSVPSQQPHISSPPLNLPSYPTGGTPQYAPQPPQPAQVPYRTAPPQQPYPPQPTHSVSYGGDSSYPANTYVAPQTNYTPDEEAVARAQKHARWAISALNFEDVKTAISELEGALKDLRGF